MARTGRGRDWKRWNRTPLLTRLLRKIVVHDTTGCWEWQGATSDGYGVIGEGGRDERTLRVHLVTFRAFRWEPSSELVRDHMCRNKRCANPWHIEEVTQAVNLERSRAA